MSKPKKPKSVAVKKVHDPERQEAIRRICVQLFCVVMFVGTLATAGYFAQQHVARKLAFPSTPPKVVLKNRPAWMSDLLAEEIVRAAKPVGAHSAFDHQVLVDINSILCASPWVREVRQVRRMYKDRPGDTIEIDCEYRAPVALVEWGQYYWLIDGEGVKLPAQFAANQLHLVVKGSDGKMNIRIIRGVNNAPVAAGKKWPGEDLKAGLDMVRLLYGQPYAEEIIKVDVSNFGGQMSVKDAQIALWTIYNTSIRWGRPVNGGNDFFVEVPTQRKLDVLKQIHAQYGRVDAGRDWVDIRLDNPTYPSTDVAKTQ